MRRVFGWVVLCALVCACANHGDGAAGVPGDPQSPQRAVNNTPAQAVHPDAAIDSKPGDGKPAAVPAADAGVSDMHPAATDAGQAHVDVAAGDAAAPTAPP